MTRDRARELLPVIQAWANGEDIQVKTISQNREDFRDYKEDSPNFTADTWEWRVKPKPREWRIRLSDNHAFPSLVDWEESRSYDPHDTLIHVREVGP